MKEDRIVITKKGKCLCKKCGANAIRSERYDAYYCEECNLWLEQKCIDPLCKL